jgi:endonuclease/exonuclease/phosphatase (EEP) superfamily protein YafD
MQSSRFKNHIAWKIIFFLSIFVVILTITGFWGRFWWAFDLTSHFRVQYFWILILSAIIFAFGKKWRTCILMTIFALVNLTLIIPYVSTSKTAQANQSKIRVLSMNLYFKNSSYKKAASFIAKSQPDILILQELTQEWENEIKETLAMFPHSIRLRYSNVYPIGNDSVKSPFGGFMRKHKLSLGLFSKLPFENTTLGQFEDYPTPYIMAQLKFKEKNFALFGVHLISPVGKVRSNTRNMQLASLANKIQKTHQPTVLLGDLNTTPWSPHFRDFIRKTGLHETRKNLGIYPSWPTRYLPLQIPIDHSLTSTGITVQSFRMGSDIGSDHFPVILDFATD